MTFSSLLSQQVARSGSCLPLDFHCCGRRTHQRQSAIRHCVCQSRVCELLRLKRSPHACSLGHRLNELQQPSAVSKDYFLPVPAQQNEVLRGTLYHITNNCSKAMSIRIHFLLPCSIWFCHARACSSSIPSRNSSMMEWNSMKGFVGGLCSQKWFLVKEGLQSMEIKCV